MSTIQFKDHPGGHVPKPPKVVKKPRPPMPTMPRRGSTRGK